MYIYTLLNKLIEECIKILLYLITIIYNQNIMKLNIFMITFALMIATVLCVMTSGSVVLVNAQSPPSPETGDSKSQQSDSSKKTKDPAPDSKSKDDGVSSSTEITTSDSNSNDAKPNKDPVKPLINAPTVVITEPKVKDTISKDCDNATKDVKDTLCKLVGDKGKHDKPKSSNGTGDTPKPFPFPKNCKDVFNKSTNSTVTVCIINHKEVITKTVKGPTKVIHTTTTPVNNYYSYAYPLTQQQSNYANSLSNNLAQYGSNGPANYLLLLSSMQLCLIAGNFDCVAQQNQFLTSSLTTLYDSNDKSWTITGTVKDVSKSKVTDLQVTALFYDGKGNGLGSNAITDNVSPPTLKSNEDGTFNFKVSVKNDLGGKNPVFIVLSYSEGGASNGGVSTSSSLAPNAKSTVGPTIGTHITKHGVPY